MQLKFHSVYILSFLQLIWLSQLRKTLHNAVTTIWRYDGAICWNQNSAEKGIKFYLSRSPVNVPLHNLQFAAQILSLRVDKSHMRDIIFTLTIAFDTEINYFINENVCFTLQNTISNDKYQLPPLPFFFYFEHTEKGVSYKRMEVAFACVFWYVYQF